MPKDIQHAGEISPLKRALLAIEDMQAKLDAAERERREPIAVIGLGCRIPGGANNPEEFWELLREGRSGVREIPRDRWDVEAYFDANADAPGKISTRFGAFLDQVDQFEPQFFGISPREALTMDPQQRLLLEVSWEAFENAGLSPTSLAKTRTGVYFGICASDYEQRLRDTGDSSLLDMHFMSGIAHSIASGRLSYTLGLQGPAISVDTACSSSLVAVHLACQGLRNGDCRVALAGGVNVILSPDSFVTMSRAGMLAADGKCKTFDAAADGFVRGEGCGVVVLKRLSQALADGDRVLALIRGTALNQDGPSSGITVPNGPSQESVIRDALANAGVSPGEVGYVEAHGTGTSLGDPIEVQAIGAVFGAGRDPAAPLQIASLKTNVGHLEAAAGVAGLIKVVLSLQHREIPQHLNFNRPSPHIPWDRLAIEVATARKPWVPINGKRIGGVSSFGFSGTNAHVVLEEAPAPARRVAQVAERPSHLLTLSARTESALRTLVERMALRIEKGEPAEIADICYTADVGRAHFSHRLAVSGGTSNSISEKLRQFLAGQVSRGSARGVWEGSDPPKIAFIFPGEGPYHAAVGRALYETAPVFRRAIDRCEAISRHKLGRSLFHALYPAQNTHSSAGQMQFVGPTLFAIEFALCELWRSWGVRPTFVLGEGVGEYVAGCVSGIFSLEDGLLLVDAHSRLATAHSSINISRDVKFNSPQLRFVSSRTGKLAEGSEIAGPMYWEQRNDGSGKFAASIDTLANAGCTIFLVAGFDGGLSEFDRENVQAKKTLWLSSLQTGQDDWTEILNSLGQLYVHGVEVDWTAFDREYARRKVSLPTYPFERDRFMVDPPPARRSSSEPLVALHPLAGQRIESPSLANIVFESRISGASPGFVGDHRVFGRIIFPAAGYLEAIRAAAELGLGGAAWTIEDFTIGEALALDEGEEKRLQVSLSRKDDDAAAFEIWSSGSATDQAKTSWTLHASGGLRRTGEIVPAERVEINSVLRKGQQLDIEAFYAGYERRGVDFGARFRGVQSVWRGEGSAVGLIDAPPVTSAESSQYGIHPALLDACIQVALAAASDVEGVKNSDALFMPLGVESFTLFSRPAGKMWSLVTLEESSPAAEIIRAHIRVTDENHKLIAEFRGISFKRAEPSALKSAIGKGIEDWFYETAWERLADTGEHSAIGKDSSNLRRWLILADRGGTGARLAERFTNLGGNCTLVFARGGDKSTGGPASNGVQMMDATSPGNLEKVVSQFAAESSGMPSGVVYLWPLDALSFSKLDADGLNREERTCCGGALQLVQSLVRHGGAKPSRLWLITRGAQKVHEVDTTISPIAATVWGLGKVIALEHPEMKCVRIDLAPNNRDGELETFCDALGVTDEEDQVALRDGQRWGARLRRARLQTAASTDSAANLAGSPYELTFAERGSIENLRLERTTRRSPDRGEVEICVRATALNFRDVMNVMDLYPGDPGPLGAECAGEIVALGEGVSGFAIGDAVVAIAPGSFSAYVTTQAELIARKPAHLSFAEAATIPVAFLTADITLNQLGKIRAGDRVLIHAAAGGVGLAAVAFAKRAGAEIFATAGSPEKRALLKNLGVPHVMDSRSLSFADEIMEITNGRGVDVVLNSLAGPFLDRTFDVIARGGRFLEIGKRGIWEPERVRSLDRDIQYFIVDWGKDTRANPTKIGTRLRSLMSEFDRGSIDPLPHKLYPLTEAKAAFRFMAQGRHIGKLILDHQTMQGSAGVSSTPLVRDDGTYLITGGLRGLGLMTAQWLVEKGARHIVLTGRHEPSADSAKEIHALESSGANVRVAIADVSDTKAMTRLLADVRAKMPPLRGIIHSANTLDDGVLLQQNWNRFATVFAPKIVGSLLLDRLTISDSLDFFVLYSSMAVVLGAPGLGSYAAANSFMTALAFARQSAGRPALSVDWGAWAGRGIAVDRGINESSQQTGLGVIDPREGFAALEMAVRSKRASLSVCPADWPKLISSLSRDGRRSPMFNDLIRPPSIGPKVRSVREESVPNSNGTRHSLLADRLAAAAPNQRRTLVVEQIRRDAARVLGLDNLELLPNNKPLNELGLDSVMAVELRNAIRAAVARNLPATLLFDYPTVDALTDYISRGVLRLEETAKVSPHATQHNIGGENLVSQIEGLDDEEIDRLLKEKEAEI